MDQILHNHANDTCFHPECPRCKVNFAAPDLLHAAQIGFEICAAMADEEHCMNEAVKKAGLVKWQEWREFFRVNIDKVVVIFRRAGEKNGFDITR